MTQNQPGGLQMLQDLASAMRQRQAGFPTEAKRPAPTDQDILRAMLGKPWGCKPVESSKSQKTQC